MESTGCRSCTWFMTSGLLWRAISQISQCIRQISHNAPFITEMCTHVHISVTNWCVVRYLSNALWGYMRLTQYGIWEMGLSAFCSSGTSLVISDVTLEHEFHIFQMWRCRWHRKYMLNKSSQRGIYSFVHYITIYIRLKTRSSSVYVTVSLLYRIKPLPKPI